MSLSNKELERMFLGRPKDPNLESKIERLRQNYLILALKVRDAVPGGEKQEKAINRLITSMVWAIQAMED